MCNGITLTVLNREKHALTMTHLGWMSSSDRFSSSVGDFCTLWWDYPVGVL